MVGAPGSGKSHFARLHLPSYSYVNMDELKSAGKCLQMLKSALAAKRSVVIDNTNPDKKSRARFVAEAKAAGVKCRCFQMLASKEHARHNNRVR
jgi:bifunctional polynucleotide phosphatase/kinase